MDLKRLIEHYQKKLSIRSRNLLELPKILLDMKNIKILDLSYNNLCNIPTGFSNLEKLESLNLSHNSFSHVPEILIKRMGNLKVLDLSWNSLKNFDSPPDCLDAILEINVSNNSLRGMPIWFFHPKCTLTKINICNNEFITDIHPIEFNKVNVLIKEFKIGNCCLRNTEFLKSLQGIEDLHLSNDSQVNGNGYFDFDDSYSKSLKTLHCSRVNLIVLPWNFGNYELLTYLDFSFNELQFLPGSIGNLQQLKIAIFSNNSLIGLPNSFINLKSLETLLLDSNKIEALPNNFETMKKLTTLDLYKNSLEHVDALKMLHVENVDLEQNYLSSDDIKMVTNYDVKKNQLRENLKKCTRDDGQYKLVLCESFSESEHSDYEENEDSELEEMNHEEVSCEEVASDCDEHELEWSSTNVETEEDFNESFDPNDERCRYPLYRTSWVPCTPAAVQPFIYADIIVEGQFDDCD